MISFDIKDIFTWIAKTIDSQHTSESEHLAFSILWMLFIQIPLLFLEIIERGFNLVTFDIPFLILFKNKNIKWEHLGSFIGQITIIALALFFVILIITIIKNLTNFSNQNFLRSVKMCFSNSLKIFFFVLLIPFGITMVMKLFSTTLDLFSNSSTSKNDTLAQQIYKMLNIANVDYTEWTNPEFYKNNDLVVYGVVSNSIMKKIRYKIGILLSSEN